MWLQCDEPRNKSGNLNKEGWVILQLGQL